MEKQLVLNERFYRQGLTHPAGTEAEYIDLFRRLQPVSPRAFARPGDPPRLESRTTMDDYATADACRADRRIVKARFLQGSIGYVHREDLPTYARAFLKPLPRLNEIQDTVFEIVGTMGPITPRQIREEACLQLDRPVRANEVGAALHRLQTAFMVFEDQPDSDWERGWSNFADEWPGIDFTALSWDQAASFVIRRFIGSMVFAGPEQIYHWSGLPKQSLKALLPQMEESGGIMPVSVPGLGSGWMLRDDSVAGEIPVEGTVFILHPSDFLSRSYCGAPERRFGKNRILGYIFLHGMYAGVLLGRWGIKQHELEDIQIRLPEAERQRWKRRIVQLVHESYPFTHTGPFRYCGESL